MEWIIRVDFAGLFPWKGFSVWIIRVLWFALVRRNACYNVDTEQPLIFVGKSDSYFGTTAEIVADSQKWILVGATKDNFTERPEIPFPGNVYACPVDFLNVESNCTVLPNLRTPETNANESAGVFEEADQMLGASIIVPEDSTKPIKICAPNWKNLRFFKPGDDNSYQVTGNCFVLNDRSDLINTAKIHRFRIPQDDLDFYKAPLIGFSISDTKIPVFDTLYGAPNTGRSSTGGLLAKNDGLIPNARSMKLEVERSKVIQDTYLTGSLFGYSIAPGNLGGVSTQSRSFYFVVGAPGFSNKNGVIGAFSVLQFGTFSQVKQIEGMQVGGGFGQTLCIADVNGDNNDEILVAAPNWFSVGDQGNQVTYDVGAVYVYYGTGSSSIIEDTAQEIRGSVVRFSRFGTAIANIGDINKDGYNDIAIGAPFENTKGAVYIFNGGRTRLEDVYSQKITGSNIKPGLQGFGWYISRTAKDLDDNMYNDFVVGAYRSDTAILLRTRNIVDVNCEISYKPEPIPLNSSGTFCHADSDFNPCFNVSVCFNFTGEGINNTKIDFTISIDANETRKRAAMINGSHTNEEITVRDFTIFSFKTSCYSLQLMVPTIDRRFFQIIDRPISLRVDYTISNTTNPRTVKAILKRDVTPTFFGQARFDTDCTGDAGVCLSNLNLEVNLDKGIVLIGNDTTLQMKVYLKNYGEPSLKTFLRINYPAAIRSNKIDVNPPSDMSCLPRNNGSSIDCESETTLYQRMVIQLDILFEVSKAAMEIDLGYVSTPSLVFNVTAFTTNDTNINDNTVIENIEVAAFTRTTLQVSTSDEQITATESSIQFSNTYRLFNEGPCVIEKVDIQFFIPVSTKDKIFIKKGDVKVQNKNIKDSCKLVYYPSKDTGTTTQNPVPGRSTIRYNTSGINVISLDSQIGTDLHLHPVPDISENSQYIFCDRRDGPYMCAVVLCTLSMVKPVDKDNRTFVIPFDIVVDELPKLQKGKSFFTFVTRGHVLPTKQSTVPLVLKKNVSEEVSISILFPDSFTQDVEKVDLTIIIGGSVGGLVLFILLGLLLWKCGFFKREKRKQVEEYKRKTRYSMRKSRMASVRSAKSGAGSIRSKVPDEEKKLNQKFDEMNDANFTT
ncbi:integrin alpha-4-like [Saccostrea echinata]|uniref:integrin alpha-4-like n=1 Tax=Saccostrea echinata TaxID=191078 RepID=UPI002A80F82D|nr:integrin alpha-4-like [Saccostrea echinata]